MQNSVAPVLAVCLAASTSIGMSSHAARTGESNRPDWLQKWQSSGQPPVFSETIPSTSTSGPHQRIRTSWASCSSGSSASSGSRSTSRTCVLRQPFAPLENLVAGDVEDLETASSSRLGSLPRATERTGPVRDARYWRTRRGRARPPRRRRRRAAARPSPRGGRRGCSGRRDRARRATPRRRRPRRSARDGAARPTVSSVWLSVPSPAVATTSTGAASFAATSASVPPSSSKRTSRPPAPSTSTRS